MKRNKGIVWLRNDFRLLKNDALAYATQNHDHVCAFYILKKKDFNKRSAQLWWLYQSIKNFKKKLNKFNINLEIVEANSYKEVFEQIVSKKNFSIYWNKVYEPDYLFFDKKTSNQLGSKKINFKIFKGNLLNDSHEIKKGDNTPYKVFTPFWRTAEKFYLDKGFNKDQKIKICEKNQNENIIVLHCPSGYPVENAGVHLNTLQSISQKYNYPIGFADHSPGGIMNYAAVALGSKMVEKTITTDKSIEHVEHFMSLEPTELKNFVENIRAIEAAMGDPNIFLTSRVDASIRRGIVAKYDIQKGEKISLESLDFQRPSTMGIPCSDGFDVISKKAAVDIQKNTFLKWEMLE